MDLRFLIPSIALFCSCNSNIEIILNPIGEMDKPLPSFHLVNSDEYRKNFSTSEVSGTYIVNFSEMKQIAEYLQSNDTSFYSASDYYSYGSYKVLLIKEHDTFSYIFSSDCSSYQLFQSIQKKVSSNNEINEDLKNLLKRINCIDSIPVK